jgi:two-component system, sensor histidine kinase
LKNLNEQYKAKILIVDENEKSQGIVKGILQDMDIDIIEVKSTSKRFSRLLSDDFALILLEVNMPDKENFQVLKTIKGHPESKLIPVILISDNYREACIRFGITTGAIDTIIRPIVPEILRGKIRYFVDTCVRQKELEYAVYFKSKFLSAMSHDIRTPLNALMGMGEVLKDDNLSLEERKRFLDILIRGGQNLLELVNDILELSKLEAGEVSINKEA